MTDTDVFMRIFAKKIRDKRKSLRMSQQALGDAAGLSRQSISSIERGNHSMTTKHLVKVADALNCDISDLLPRIR